MKRVRPHSVGLVFSLALGVGHALWLLFGWLCETQPAFDSILRLYRITPRYTMVPFNFETALGLVLLTALVAYTGGWLAGSIWNRYRPIDKKPPDWFGNEGAI